LNTTLVSSNLGGVLWSAKSNKKGAITFRVQEPNKNIVYKTADSLLFALTNQGQYFLQQVSTKPASQHEKVNKVGNQLSISFYPNKATGKKIFITTTPTSKYPGQGGAFSLVNGVYSQKGLSYPDWLGWVGDDLEATMDLGKTTSFDSVRVHTLDQNGSWIYLPQYIEVFTSNDGNQFTSVGKSSTFVGDTLTMGWIKVPTPNQSSRFIKVVAKNYGLIPDGKPGAENKAWLFADEIQVY
jgi:hexosaminidase